MLFIRHRINTVKDLKSVPADMGVEVDIRYEKDRLILHHDPYVGGEDFENYLKEYNHSFIILNTKSEGLEEKILELLKKYKIKNYFFLDLSFPALIKLAKTGEKNIAVRYSEYEPLEQAMALKNMVSWVWVDCFSKLPLTNNSYNNLKKHFKLCLVSPELQKRSTDRIKEFKLQISNYNIEAVCTKVPELWQ